MKRLLNRECSDCGGSKHISISLQSNCTDCGLAPLDISFEIPAEKADEILPRIFTSFESVGLQPTNERVHIPTYDELLKRINRRME